MVRISKVGRIRHVSFKRPKAPSAKTGPKKDNLTAGYKQHVNTVANEKKNVFIPKIK